MAWFMRRGCTRSKRVFNLKLDIAQSTFFSPTMSHGSLIVIRYKHQTTL
uniref:Uncharacterized protein n=1 Tax=Setaria italica TaxID=4555 RepID=K3Z241_SETIT